MKYRERIEKLITALADGLYERTEIVALTLLTVLSGQSVFLFGKPGTAKSMIARRISRAFKNSAYFENLMNRFSTPEDVFGPVDVKELKEGRYKRKTARFLPTAAVAFLDEIWKSSTAILNTLLTIVNERIFRNGDDIEEVPLKGIIAASNETVPENQGLDALDDRLIMRLNVDSLQQKESFENLLRAVPVKAKIDIDESLTFDDKEWAEIIELSSVVDISRESFNIIHSIRAKIDGYNRDHSDKPIYISDRRWQKIAQVLKTSAFLCDRDCVLPVDLLVLKNCIWTKADNRNEMAKIVVDSVREFCPYNSEEYEKWEDELQTLSEEVEETFFYDSDIYETDYELGGEKCFRVLLKIPYYERKRDSWGGYSSDMEEKRKDVNAYIPLKHLKQNGEFKALGEDGDEIYSITCNFKGTTQVTIRAEYQYQRYSYGSSTTKYAEFHWDAKPTYRKGDCKKVTPRTKSMYKKNVQDHIAAFDVIETNVKQYYVDSNEKNRNPFVPEKDRLVVTAAIQEYLKQMAVGKLNAEQLFKKLDNHVDA